MASRGETGAGRELTPLRGDAAGVDPFAVRPVRPGDSETPAEETAPPDATALWRALGRCWVRATGLGLVAALVAGLSAWGVMPGPKFATRATLQASSAPPRILTTAGGERADFGTYLRTQVAMIKSRLVLNHLLAEPGIASLPLLRDVGNPLEWLEKEIQVDSSGGTEFLKISLKGEYPEDLATLVNELTATYLRDAREQEARERSERLRKLSENYERYLADRLARRNTLRRFAEDVGSNDRRTITLKQELDLERIEMTRRELLLLQSELRRSRVELGVIEARARLDSNQPVSAWAVAEEVATDPVVSSQTVRLVDLEGRLATARRTIRGEGDPAIHRVREQLESTRRALTHRRQEVMTAAGRRMGEEATRDMVGRIALGQERVAILAEQERILVAEVDRLAEDSHSLKKASIALEDSRGEMDQADEMVKKIATEIEAQKVELMAPTRVRLLETADVPTRRDTRPRLKATIAAAGGAFALSLLTFTWRESQAGRIDSTQIVKRILGLKLIGVLPRLVDKHRMRIARPDTPGAARGSSLYHESIDSARAMILRILDGQSSRAFLVSSALKAEGKTSLSCHLAASIARAGKLTVLVDGDLRIPSAHKLYGMPLTPGLSEVMRGELTLEQALRPTTYEGLMFLPAGECDSAALDVLNRGELGGLFARLREQFEIIVVDSSPILPVADPIQLGRHCDAIIVSILENVSTIPAVRAAFDRLGSIDVPIVGAVVAGSPMMHYKYQFYRKPPSPRTPGPAAAAAAAARGKTSLPAADSPRPRS